MLVIFATYSRPQFGVLATRVMQADSPAGLAKTVTLPSALSGLVTTYG